MAALAISAAAAVRVGQAIGRNAPREAASAGWGRHRPSELEPWLFPSAIDLLFPARHRQLFFTEDPRPLSPPPSPFFVAAIFQFFDVFQITATGALRGAGNTHAGLYVQIIGYWIIGLPIGYLIAFRYHHGAVSASG